MYLRRSSRQLLEKMAIKLRQMQRRIADKLWPPLFDYQNETLNDRWIIESIFLGKRNGYFIEAGAATGIGASCTYLLEKEFGWTGLCVEPNTQFFAQLVVNRPNSHCENVCLARQAGTVSYIEGSDDTVSPYLGGIKSNLKAFKYGGEQVIERGIEIYKPAMTLASLLDKHCAPPIIEYAAFDVEGSELEILEGFPFQRYTILALSIECDYLMWDDITRLMKSLGYREVSNPYNIDKVWERYWLHKSLAIFDRAL
jgi:hypothetical protein